MKNSGLGWIAEGDQIMQGAQIQLTTEQLFEAIRKLPTAERRKLRAQLDQLSDAAAGHQSQRRAGKTDAETEAELLTRIRLLSRLPEKAQRRFNRLRRKRQDETITETELTELQGLWDRVEWMSVERLEALIELAQRRGTDVQTLMHGLGLSKKRDVF
jgi:Skp family chaperone for outer membrane proteins